MKKSEVEKLRAEITKEAVVFEPAVLPKQASLGRVHCGLKNTVNTPYIDGEMTVPFFFCLLPEKYHLAEPLEKVRCIAIYTKPHWDESVFADEFCDDAFVAKLYDEKDLLVSEVSVAENTDVLTPCYLEETVVGDFPCVYTDGILEEIQAKIDLLSRGDKDYEHFVNDHMHYQTKIGGHPSYIQNGFTPPDGYVFVCQVASTPKANLNIVDNGIVYFFYNPETKQWKVYHEYY